METHVDRARLLRAVPDGPFDAYALLVARMLDADHALITLIDPDDGTQRFAGHCGLTPPLSDERSTPLRLSLCAHVADDDVPVVLPDLDGEDWSAAHPARTELGVRAYAGVPLRTPDGVTVGAVCAWSPEPRPWTDEQLQRLTMLRDHLELDLVPLMGAADAVERADEVSLVLSTLRHELGSELTVVLGGIETAQLPGIPKDVHDRVLATAAREAHRVIDTLDALLRLDQRAPVRPKHVDLAEVTRSAINNAAVAGTHQQLTFDATPLMVQTEPTLVGRVVANLADNACKYGDGPIHVTVGRRADGRAGVTVADTGPGLPDASVAQLFAPFTRTHADGDQGFGLGMFIIRMLTDRLGADLEVASSDAGTTISMWLPENA